MQPQFDEYRDEWGVHRSYFLPMRTSSGLIYVIGADSSIASITNELNALRLRLFLQFLALFAAAMAIAWISFSSAISALERLSDYATAITTGKLSPATRLTIKRDDEIGVLARHIDEMTQTLQQTISNLDAVVSARTKELEELNAKLREQVHDEQEKRFESEQLFASIFQNAILGIVVLDKEGHILLANNCITSMLGYTNDELKERTVIDLTDPNEREQTLQNIDRLVKGEIPSYSYKKHCLNKSDERVPVEVDVFPIRSQEGEAVYIVGIVEDLREKIALAQQQKHQEQLLIQQSKLAAMGEMIGMIAHQWRQPLNALGLQIQDIQEAWQYGELDEAYLDQAVAKAMQQINFMSKTIDDFRNFFQSSTTKERFNLKKAIEETLSLIGAQLNHHSIHVTIEGDDDLFVEGYLNEFKQALLNLITNAKDAIVDHHTTGSITLRITHDDRGNAILSVCDNGGGIPEAIMDRIFEPYFTTKEQGKGTGIGLYMTNIIVEKHKGTISVANSDQGACFTVTLPISSPA